MIRLLSCVATSALIFALASLEGRGQTKTAPPSSSNQKGGGTKIGKGGGSKMPADDPEVVEYCQKKGWALYPDWLAGSNTPTIFMTVRAPKTATGDGTLTAEDYKMIARSKKVQFLNLSDVQCTDEGLKAVVGIPQLEGIYLAGDAMTDAGLKELARSKSLALVNLRFTKTVTDAGVKELAALPKLSSLSLSFVKFTGSGLEPFVGSKTLTKVNLQSIVGFTDEGARYLAKLPKLEELQLTTGYEAEKKLTTAGIKAIVDAHLPANFVFSNDLIDDDLLESLVAKGWLFGPSPSGSGNKTKPALAAGVKQIVLSHSKVTDKGILSLLPCSNLNSIFLDDTKVTDQTLKTLAAFKKLEYLNLENTKVTGTEMAALSELPIRHLALEGCQLSEEAFKAMGKMTGLKELWLRAATIKPDWLKHIADLPNLTELGLMRTDFDDSAVKYLTTLPKLKDLTLNNTGLSDKGFEQLLALPNLKSLLVDSTKVTKEVYQKAKKDHPKLRLYFYTYDR